MKKFFIVVLVIILSSIVFLFIYDFRSEQEHFFSTYQLSPSEMESIQDGDIILRHGFGFVSDMIVKTLHEKPALSHCAIICKKPGQTLKVIHSVSQSLSEQDGVQEQSFNDFIKDSQPNSVVIVRYQAVNGSPNSKISEAAFSYLKKKIPFDNSFDLQDSSSFYCSELIYRIILNEYQDDIFEGKSRDSKEIQKLSYFTSSQKFKIILNHQDRKK